MHTSYFLSSGTATGNDRQNHSRTFPLYLLLYRAVKFRQAQMRFSVRRLYFAIYDGGGARSAIQLSELERMCIPPTSTKFYSLPTYFPRITWLV